MAVYGELSTKQSRLLNALLAGKSVDEAAKDAGCSQRTAYRYLNETTFKVALRDAREDFVDGALKTLQLSSQAAVRRLIALLLDKNTAPALQVRICEVIVKLSLDSTSLIALERKLGELEQTMHEQGFDLKKVRGAHGHLRPIR